MDIRKTILSGLLALTAALIPAGVSAESITVDSVTIMFEELSDGSIKLLAANNGRNEEIKFVVDGTHGWQTAPQSKLTTWTKIAKNQVKYVIQRTGTYVWLWERKKPIATTDANDMPKTPAQSIPTQQSGGVFERVDNDSYYGNRATSEFVEMVNQHISGLNAAADKEAYISQNRLRGFVAAQRSEIEDHRASLSSDLNKFMSKATTAEKKQTESWVEDRMKNRLRDREDAINNLASLMPADTAAVATSGPSGWGALINWGLLLLFVIGAVWVVIKIMRRRAASAPLPAPSRGAGPTPLSNGQPADGAPGIIVRRKTASILKKQSLDDVYDNPSYYVIDMTEISADSTVKRIFVKNAVIRDVYNMYAEDLRNSDQPKEDGCMVVGRWVRDSESRYDVSLEEVVYPGDDADFQEYELNFGGKIKLSIFEKLRKLRKDTGLQYNLTCWIHSHPGLGVFFSNSDVNVQNQLNDPQCPGALVAFVVDILTSDQQLGVFTFRNDGNINSRNDLNRMLSLEQMYKWAIESGRNSYDPSTTFDLLKDAAIKTESCAGIELNNNSIIDMTQRVAAVNEGIAGWLIGYPVEADGRTRIVVTQVEDPARDTDPGIIGCLLSVPHRSLPTLQRYLSTVANKEQIKTVIVYASRTDTVTAIPVINGNMLADEQFYSEIKFDDLKTWTRRKR